MAGQEPPIQWLVAGAELEAITSGAQILGDRVKPGHGEI
jgi:hypothetical protein